MKVGPEQLRIDKLDLDNEVIQQPELFYYACEQLAAAQKRVSALDAKVDRLIAEAMRRLRSEAEAENKKPVETKIKIESENAPEVREAKRDLRDAILDRDVAEGLKESFKQRSYALKDLAQLHVAQYFADESVSGAGRAKREEEYDKNKSKLANERKKRND